MFPFNPVRQLAEVPPHPLASLGVSTDLIREAMYTPFSRAQMHTQMAPAGSRGGTFYHCGMESLHEHLSREGWSMPRILGQPRIVHPQNSAALVVRSAIGLVSSVTGRGVRTAHSAGPALMQGVACNDAVQPALFGDSGPKGDNEGVMGPELAPLWVILHELTETGCYLALARPVGCARDGVVDQWEDFLPLEPILVAPLVASGLTDDTEEEFHVPVRRRSE